MTSFINRVFGRNSHGPATTSSNTANHPNVRRGPTSAQANPSHPSPTPVVPLDLPYVLVILADLLIICLR